MSVSFYPARRPADPADLEGWKLGDSSVNVTATNAGQLFTLLGLPADSESVLSGEHDPADLARRIAVARVEGLSVAYERWGAWHFPGYFEGRLDDLSAVASEAKAMGGKVFWA